MPRVADLRTFLEVLREKDQLVEIKKTVELQHEIGSVLAALEKHDKGAGLFTSVKDRAFPVCGGILGSMDRVALALECEKSGINDLLADCIERPIKSKTIVSGLCQENVILGEQVDLGSMPIPVHAPKDGGPFITAGITVSREPSGTAQNLSFHRMQVKGRNKLSIMINEWRHLKEFYNEAEKQGKRLPVAIICGADPAIYICAGLRCSGDELEIAGAIRGTAIKTVKCITSDIQVPAAAEFIIEGEILPDIREEEGPLGEFTGHYGNPWPSPVIEVTAITHRNGAIYQTINGASFEHINLGNVLPREPLLKKFASHVSSGVLNVHIPPYGSGFLALVQIRKKNPGEPKNVALAAMMTYVNIKNVIVVDEDVDIYNPADVMWALSNRVIPERDIFYIPNAQGHELDPCSDQRGVQTKMGIDATLSEESRGFERVRYNEADLKPYLE